MRKIAKSVLITIIVAIFAACLFSCGSTSGGEGQISVKENAMPQLIHVLGEDLDLSNGVLEYTSNGETKEIPLNSADVSVSGYSKDVLGEQTLTVTYNGCTTEITVTVVERMVAEGFVADYLLGDDIDLSKGRVRITRNDGTNFTALLKSNKVTVSGFDYAKVGAQTLSVAYESAGQRYTCSFVVNVHDAESVSIKMPTKTTYHSHDTSLNLKGGAILLKGLGGAVEREIPLTAEGVEVLGFDPTAVSDGNSPISQELTVNYRGHSLTFAIDLIYSDISLLYDNVERFGSYSFTGNTLPVITEADGELAVRMMDLYTKLSYADKSYITYDDALLVARVAFAYGIAEMEDELEKVEGGFVIKEGQLSITCESRDGVRLAVEALSDTDGALYRLSDVMIDIAEEFEDAPVLDHGKDSELFFGSLALADTETYEYMLGLFNHMLLIDAAMDDVPDGYKETGAFTYASVLDTIYEYMCNEAYIESGFGGIYAMVDGWNANIDIIDMMYQYFYISQNNTDALALLSYVRFPSGLDGIVRLLGKALDEQELLEGGYVIDSTWLLYYYYNARSQADALKTYGAGWEKILYDILPVNGMLALDGDIFYIDNVLDILLNGEGGVRMRVGGLVDMKEYDDLMALYVGFLARIMDDADAEYVGSAAYGEDVEEIFSAYANMPPTQQYLFLSALNVGYSEGKLPLIFNAAGTAYADEICLFVRHINNYFEGRFSESGVSVYRELVLAMEIYARRFFDTNGLSDFEGKMNVIGRKIGALSSDDSLVFKDCLEGVYDRYVRYADMHKDENKIEDLGAFLGKWEADFIALQDAITNAELAYVLNSQQSANGIFSYTTLISAFEKANRIYNDIKNNAPAEIVEALYHMHIYGVVGGVDDGRFYGTFDYSYQTYRSIYVTYLLTVTDGGIYDSYVGSELQEFMYLCNDAVWPYLWHAIEGKSGDVAFDVERVMAAIDKYASLDESSKFAVMLMENMSGYFYASRDAFLDATLTEDAAAVAKSTFLVENDYILYYYTGEETYKLKLQQSLSSLKAMYSLLAGDDEASFDKVEHIYNDLIGKCEDILSE